jgi:hypothetical protein
MLAKFKDFFPSKTTLLYWLRVNVFSFELNKNRMHYIYVLITLLMVCVYWDIELEHTIWY